MIRPFVGLLLVASLAACGGSSSDRDDTADPGTSQAPETPAVDIDWEECGAAECATIALPVDHDDPEGATIDIFVSRVPATGERYGALWMNFGGPGARAASTVATWPVPDEIREHFDLVGMDPRGVGGSSPLECGIPALELYAADPTIDEPADVDELLDVSTRFADDCAAEDADLLPHLGTRDVVEDMVLISEMMGDDRIDFLGYSYGTSIGQVLAEEFPERVRTMVLDGIVDPALTGPELAVGQAAGFEQTLARWAATCEGRTGCTLDDPISAVDRVIGLAEGGIPAGDGRTVGPGEVAIALAYPLYAPALWPSLDTAVDRALAMDGAPMADLAAGYAGLVDFSVYFAVSCLDSQWPSTPREVLDIAAAAGVEAPRFGEAIVNDYVRCPVWPVGPDPLGEITATDAPPVLLVSTTGDAATPHENGLAVARRMPSARLLTHEGDGHTIVFQGDECIDRIVVDYIVNQSVPDDGITC